MKIVSIQLKKGEDALLSFPKIAESVAKGCDGGWVDGVKWNVEEVSE